MDDRPAPVLGQPGDCGEFVAQARGRDHPASVDDVTAAEFDPESLTLPGESDGAPGEHLGTEGTHLLAGDAQEVGRGAPLVPEVVVHVGGRCIAGFTGVDDDDRATLPRELKGGGQSCGGPSDDGHVDMPLDACQRVTFLGLTCVGLACVSRVGRGVGGVRVAVFVGAHVSTVGASGV